MTSTMIPTILGPLAVFPLGPEKAPRTILLWPSIFTDHHIYGALSEILCPRYRLLLVDGPAHGQSPGSTTGFTAAQCAQAMGQILDAFALKRAVVGGTSWGGLAAAELALTAPERVSALILLNTPFGIDGRRPTLKARFIATGARWGLRSRIFRDGVARSFFLPASLARDPAYRAAFHDMLRNAPPRQFAAAIRSVILSGTPLADRAPMIGVPTLVIAGSDDSMYLASQQRESAARIPGADFATVPGRHISVIDAPEAVAEMIDAFLARREATNRPAA
jgi:3-oxoadipate enol-lactonase